MRWRDRSHFVLAAAFAVGLVACGDDGGSADDQSAAAPDDPAALVERGEELAGDRGCRSCHKEGGGGIGPDWEGLAGSTVELDGGTTVVADSEYLTRAIVDPGAEKVDGYSLAMPDAGLPDDEVAALVAYIESLGEPVVAATEPGGSTP